MAKKDKSKKERILVVDDDWSIQQLLKSTLELAGFDVTVAGTAGEFRKLAKDADPDAIILDIMLGDDDGTQVYDEMLREGFDRSIPVIFLSALASDQTPVPPQKGRRFALIGKPFDPQVLVNEIKAVLKD